MLLEMASDAMGDRVAVGPRSGGLTYTDLLDRSRRAAAVVTASHAERLGLVDVNSDIVPTLLFAAGIAGVPFAPVNYRLADDRLRDVVGRLAPAMVLCADECVERLSGIELVGVTTSADFAASIGDADPKDDSYTDPDQVAV